MVQFISSLTDKTTSLGLVIFRFLFGLVIFWEMGRLVLWSDVINYKYINSVFHFKYPYFSWVKQAPDFAMYVIVFSVLILAILFSFGILSRLVSLMLFVGYTYLEIIDVTYWNNHYYFYVLVLFTFIFIPTTPLLNVLYKRTVELNYTWNLYILKFLVVIVLFYGGISKLSNPGWISGDSCYYLLKLELEKKSILLSDSWIIILSQIMTWGGLIFDLIAGFLLLKRIGFFIVLPFFLIFNLTNFYLFNIGSFPIAMLSTLILFVNTKYYDKLLKLTYISPKYKPQKVLVYGVLIFAFFQLLIPLRHFFIKGNVIWTGESKLYSWHMMSGATSMNNAKFVVIAIPPGKQKNEKYDLDLDKYINKQQKRTLAKLPYVAKQFADFVEQEMTLDGYSQIKVFADIYVSRNNKPLKPIINPYTDLTKVEVNYWSHNEWILLYLDEEL